VFMSSLDAWSLFCYHPQSGRVIVSMASVCVSDSHHHHQLFSHMKHAHTLYRDNSIHMCELDYMSTSDTDNNPEVNA